MGQQEIMTVPFVEFEIFTLYELMKLSEKFTGVNFKDIAFLFEKDEKEGTIKITAEHPLAANGHSITGSYRRETFSSFSWKIIAGFAKEKFPEVDSCNIRSWINLLDKEVDLTVDY